MSFTTLLILAIAPAIWALDNGLGQSPPMGWNSWNRYTCDINETVILNNAKAMKETGLLELGYNHIIMDDCWSKRQRDPETGKIVPDPEKFPNGLEDMIEKIHNMGFKFGMYSSAGKYTCAGYPGSLDYEEIDAKTFADWKIDYLKYDNCFNQGRSGTPLISYQRYEAMSEALNKTGRPIFYALCQWGEDQVWNWASTVANSWRITGDIYDSFDRYDIRCPCETYDCPSLQGYHCSIMNIVNKATPLAQKTGPNSGWSDMDMLEIGNGGMTYDEYLTHFTMWAVLKSPLILGNDVSNMSPEHLALVSNFDVIAVHQDVSAPANRIWKKPFVDSFVHLFSGALSNGDWVVAIVNEATVPLVEMSIPFSDIFFDNRDNAKFAWTAKDLWTKETITAARHLTVDVVPHGTQVWRLQKSTHNSHNSNYWTGHNTGHNAN
ncbi:alpha-galactosidase, melibiase [Schizosaccharomyces osmophilus]|uniref:Alpha-galactosidase n=1 Tax=Schizosaccharomyces osmophilus TaxID=2545709 RepID=A0AAE9W6Z1_9SCHI|nr:alpha-galactosidase, melibiase [Schizosaccharomyces osmophilus]WBW71122.1 alpha-galactosidase, melibiase [Schizosaccharomyces osmophilus]